MGSEMCIRDRGGGQTPVSSFTLIGFRALWPSPVPLVDKEATATCGPLAGVLVSSRVLRDKSSLSILPRVSTLLLLLHLTVEGAGFLLLRDLYLSIINILCLSIS